MSIPYPSIYVLKAGLEADIPSAKLLYSAIEMISDLNKCSLTKAYEAVKAHANSRPRDPAWGRRC